LKSSKYILEEEKREKRSQDVNVKLGSSTTTGFTFVVYKDDSEKIKYFGEISKDHQSDECTCQSFYHGNSENYKRDNPLPFQCKHIIAAWSIMEGFW